MTSSTSHSETRVPVLAVQLLAVAVATWMACAAYTLWLNPEIRFYTQLSTLQDSWSQKMDREHTHKVVVFGGSSCTFSVNGEQMLEAYGLPTVNRGLAAGFGVKIPALHAMKDLRAGDTLIVALEPGQLTGPDALTSLAVQFSYAKGHPGWATRPALGLPKTGLASTLLALRPGSYHVLTLAGKILQGRALYRYSVADAAPSGWMHTDVRIPLTGPPGHGPRLSDDARRFLFGLKDWCMARHIRVAYSLPWGYTPPGEVEESRKNLAGILLQIAEFIPVFKDPSLGADPDSEHFADTLWHLNEAGSRLRTKGLGRAVKQWDLWTSEELRSFAGAGR